ncbi:MAG: hypothetical protein ABII00_06745 [Elusimicrobiota bacterium]
MELKEILAEAHQAEEDACRSGKPDDWYRAVRRYREAATEITALADKAFQYGVEQEVRQAIQWHKEEKGDRPCQ